jgi:hypothetical protein
VGSPRSAGERGADARRARGWELARAPGHPGYSASFPPRSLLGAPMDQSRTRKFRAKHAKRAKTWFPHSLAALLFLFEERQRRCLEVPRRRLCVLCVSLREVSGPSPPAAPPAASVRTSEISIPSRSSVNPRRGLAVVSGGSAAGGKSTTSAATPPLVGIGIPPGAACPGPPPTKARRRRSQTRLSPALETAPPFAARPHPPPRRPAAPRCRAVDAQARPG